MIDLRYLLLMICALTTCATAQDRDYREPPGDLNMEGKYRSLGRLAFTGQMGEAEGKASALLGQGYRGTRYECWIHDKLATGYERQRNKHKAIAAWKEAMLSSDPSKGTWDRARKKILAHGGTPPAHVARATSPSPVTRFASARPHPTRQPERKPAVGVQERRAPTPARGTPATTTRLLRDPAYQSALADLQSGTYQGVRAAIKKFESLVLDRGYQGSSAETELQARIADAHLALALQHYRWAKAVGKDTQGEAAQRARRRAVELERLGGSRVASAR